jgi:hypothetical protein
MAVKTTCPGCGQRYTLGYDGTVQGCDSCTGARRDRGGAAWLPGERYQKGLKTGRRRRVRIERPKKLR